MAQPEHFPKAPIVEALIDLKVTFPSPVEATTLEAFHERIRADYPRKEARVQWRGEIQVAAQAVQQAVRRDTEGFIFTSQDGRRRVQARQDGYTYNRLRPYPTWQEFRDDAKRNWQLYRETFHPEAVTRIGLRYINRIELPLPFRDFRDFIRTAPDIAEGMPQGLSAMFMRLEIPDNERGLIAIVTETIEPPIDDGRRLPVIFDIDVVRSTTFVPDSASIWEIVEGMRDYKNEIFFASVTERAKEMFR